MFFLFFSLLRVCRPDASIPSWTRSNSAHTGMSFCLITSIQGPIRIMTETNLNHILCYIETTWLLVTWIKTIYIIDGFDSRNQQPCRLNVTKVIITFIKRRVQFSEDCFGPTTYLPFLCYQPLMWSLSRHVKMIFPYPTKLHNYIQAVHFCPQKP